eukprot:6490643-Amphidinium_carterae.2
MASGTADMTESEAVFRERASASGFTEGQVNAMIAKRINTLAKFAFSSSYQAGISNDDAPLVNLARRLFDLQADAEVDLAVMAAMRMLSFQAYSLAAAEVHREAMGPVDVPKKLAPVERQARKQAQQTRLNGIRIAGQHDPSDAMVDLFCAMFDANRVSWVPWEKLTRRSQEVTSDRSDPTSFVLDVSTGSVRSKPTHAEIESDLSSDLLIYFALQRRGLALEQARLLPYEVHSLWIDELFEARLRPQTAGFTKTSLQQLRAADQQLWLRLAESCQAGIRMDSNGTSPLEEHFKRAMYAADVQQRLVALPSSGQVGAKRSSPAEGSHAEPAAKTPQASGKGNKNQRERRAPGVMPDALTGGVPTKKDGAAICFGYNMGKCPYKVEPGHRCNRGYHVCCAPGCEGKHPFPQHGK